MKKILDIFGEYVLMLDVFSVCIKQRVLPGVNSPCHKRIKKMVKESGMAPKRKRK